MKKYNLTWEQSVIWLRNQPDQIELVKACYYDDPLIESAIRFESSEEWREICKYLPAKKGFALDLGAGRGISSYALANVGWIVTALEPDPSPIVGRTAIADLARLSNLPITPLDGFAEKIPCDDHQFDLVLGRQVMHHAHDLQKMCNEIQRVLKPGGIFISTREHVITHEQDKAIFLSSHPLHRFYLGENAFLLDEYLYAIKNSGLKIRKILGPMETVINYFPLSKRQWELSIQKPVRERLGDKISNVIFSEGLPWNNIVNKFLAIMNDKKNNHPGRLYSFITMKD